MAKPELGHKRTCVACGTKFYDLLRAPAVCPKCATEQPAEVPRVRRTSAADDRLKKRAAVAPVADAEPEAEVVELEEVEAEDAVEDAEELEDEAEAIEEEIEVEADREEET